MIEVERLTKNYGTRCAIDDLSFVVKKGEIVGFLGPNGAGKTTTMRILAGYMPPTAGRAKVAGFDVVEESLEVRRRVGYLPETVPLYADMSVEDYLRFMADLRHIKQPAVQVNEVIAQVHLSERSKSLVGNLSKGMRQRVGLAQALIHRPDVLILDEPTIGLDPAQIIDVRNLILELRKERAVLLSTHILSEVQQICDRVLIINHGKIVAEDSPERLEARLAGAQRIRLAVSGNVSDQQILGMLHQVQGVTRARKESESVFEIESQPGNDPRAAVARAIIAANLDLLEMHSIGMSLEEIFLQLTREETAVHSQSKRRKFRDRVDSKNNPGINVKSEHLE